MESRIAKYFNEISSYTDLYDEEVNKKLKEMGNSVSFYDIFYTSRRVVYNIHKRETIKLYMLDSMKRDEATLKYENEFITEDEYVFYRRHYDE
jgi:hypothetical protein